MKKIIFTLLMILSIPSFSQQQSLLKNKIKVYDDYATFTLLVRNDQPISKSYYIELDDKKSKKSLQIPPKKEKRFTFKVTKLESGKVRKFRICSIPDAKKTDTLITRICSIGQVYRY